MDATELSLLRAICAEKGEDTPRLVYADWLDEQGRSERAEFIRVQCELIRFDKFDPAHRKEFNDAARAKLASRMTRLERGESESVKYARAVEEGGRMYAARRDYLRRRDKELFDANICRWEHGRVIPNAAYRTASDYHPDDRDEPDAILLFRRGFISEVRCPCAAWLAHADALYWHPSQTVECPACGGDGETYSLRCPRCEAANPRTRDGGAYTTCCRELPVYDPCPACRGTGRVPRPFPATAQPIERVTLTTRPEGGLMFLGFGAVARREGQTFASDRWPGVTFELPPPTPAEIAAAIDATGEMPADYPSDVAPIA